jgi:hypothetical protein
MMRRHKDIHPDLFARLHKLQELYYSGKFERGSLQHAEILALEDVESVYVQREMKQFHQVEQSLANRLGQKTASIHR